MQRVIFSENALLNLNFLEEEFRRIQKTGEGFKTVADIENYKPILKQWLRGLAEKIQRDNSAYHISDAAAWEILRRKHVLFLSRYFHVLYPDGSITHKYSGHLSKQMLVGPFYNCNLRWMPLLPALRKHVFSVAGSNAPLLQFYHHTSPVPYDIENFAERIRATISNFVSLATQLNNPPSITEVRLLSPWNTVNNTPHHRDYQQVFETYLAIIRSRLPIHLFNYGINIGRVRGESELQAHINLRATNQLFEKIFLRLNIALPRAHTAVRDKRAQLTDSICQIDLADNQKARAEFENQVKKHHLVEEGLFADYQNDWNDFLKLSRPRDQHTRLIEAMHLFLNLRRHAANVLGEYNGQIQAMLIEINYLLGEAVCMGCNDAKDRDGMVTVTLEAMHIFYQTNGRYPFPFPLPHAHAADEIHAEFAIQRARDIETLADIQRNVCLFSTPQATAEAVSWPHFARGLNGTDQIFSGFGHLAHAQTAGLFKKIYGKAKPLTTAHELMMSIANQLYYAEKEKDTQKSSAIKLALLHDPLFADIKNLTFNFELSLFNKYPLLQYALYGASIALMALAIGFIIASCIVFPPGFVGVAAVATKAVLFGAEIALLFGATGISATLSAVIGMGVFALLSSIAAAVIGGLIGMLTGLRNRSVEPVSAPSVINPAQLMKWAQENPRNEKAAGHVVEFEMQEIDDEASPFLHHATTGYPDLMLSFLATSDDPAPADPKQIPQAAGTSTAPTLGARIV